MMRRSTLRLALPLLLVTTAIVAAARTLPFYSDVVAQYPELQYRAENGKEYPYPRGADSLSWARKARNLLRQGSVCGAFSPTGTCLDPLHHAPVGGEMPYASSLHIYAIAWLHRLLALFDPLLPIPASAFWLQVIIGTLAVIPAFYAGWLLGGPAGAILAPLVAGLDRTFLNRSLTGDNDVWNVELPLTAVAFALAALRPGAPRRAWAAGVGVGVSLGLHAAIWSGWPFATLVVVTGVLAAGVWAGVTALAAKRPIAAELRSYARVVLSAAVAMPLTLLLTLGPTQTRNTLIGSPPPVATTTPSIAPAAPAVFPDGLRWITETQPTTLSGVVRAIGGPAMLFLAILGAMCSVAPRLEAAVVDFALPAVLAGCSTVALVFGPSDKVVVAVALLFPFAIALAFRFRLGDGGGARRADYAWIVATWFTGGMVLSLTGTRYVMLAAPAVGLAAAAGAGVVHDRLRRLVKPSQALALAAVVSVAFVARPIQVGFHTANTALPTLNDAWWDSLVRLRQTSPPNSIVFSSWDTGYAIQYVAERATATDGASVLRRAPTWVARALLAATEREAVGLFRMLACGSDVAPDPEGGFGAYERLLAAGIDGVRAHATLIAIASLDREEAALKLTELGLETTQRQAILEATHCTPEPAYLVVSDRILGDIDLRYRGSWNVARAELFYRLRDRTDVEILSEMTTRLGYSAESAKTELARLRRLHTTQEIDAWIAPARPFDALWVPCESTSDGRRSCSWKPRRQSNGSLLEGFSYDPPAAELGTLRFTAPHSGKRIDIRPQTTLAMGRTAWKVAKDDAATDDFAAVVDTDAHRVLLGAPALIRSVFTRMLLLDGRYLQQLEKVDDRHVPRERVTTWRIHWEPVN